MTIEGKSVTLSISWFFRELEKDPEGSVFVSVIQPLLVLQEIDGRIREFEQELKDIPARIAQEKERLESVCSNLADAQTALQTAKSRADDLEAEVQTRQTKIQALKKEQGTLKSNSDYKNFNLQITALEGEMDRFSHQAVDAMEDMKQPKRRVEEAEAKLSEEQLSVDGFVAELNERMASVKEELDKAMEERKASAEKVDGRWLAYYERMRVKRWPVLVPLLPDRVCAGCHLVQSPSIGQMVLRNTKAGEDTDVKEQMVPCQMCGRLLYTDR